MRCLRSLAICLASALALAALSRSHAVAAPHDVVLIIANQDYEGALPPVKFAHNDADAYARMFRQAFGVRKQNIVILKDADYLQMKRAFGETGRLAQILQQDRANIYVVYSGHGVPAIEAGATRTSPYLLPINGDPADPVNSGHSLASIKRKLLALRRKRAPKGRIVLFIDACFSGSSAGGDVISNAKAVGLAVDPKELVDSGKPGLITFAAAQGNEFANWDENRKISLFSDAIIDGLYGEADKAGDGDRSVTLRELYSFVSQRMADRLAKLYPTRHQVPAFSNKGEIELVTPKDGAVRFPDLLAQEQVACRIEPKHGTIKSLTTALASCRYCPCRTAMKGRLKRLEDAGRVCKAERARLEAAKSKADDTVISILANQAQCLAVRQTARGYLEAKAGAEAAARTCNDERRRFETAKGADDWQAISALAKRARCPHVRAMAAKWTGAGDAAGTALPLAGAPGSHCNAYAIRAVRQAEIRRRYRCDRLFRRHAMWSTDLALHRQVCANRPARARSRERIRKRRLRRCARFKDFALDLP